jgi:hypothetical protein
MEIRTERIVYGVMQYIKETKKTVVKTIEKALVYIHEAVEMPDGKGERINYRV